MAKYTVLRGKVSIGSKRYTKGDVFEITVKDAEKFPQSMIKRVAETPAPKTEEPAPTPAPPEPVPEVADEQPEEKIRVTI